jgi:hypothetical protein
MPLTLHITPPEQIDELVERAVRPLDHEYGTIECCDPELTPTRARTVMRVRTRVLGGDYVVDPDAVAGALIERMRPAGPMTWLHARAV